MPKKKQVYEKIGKRVAPTTPPDSIRKMVDEAKASRTAKKKPSPEDFNQIAAWTCRATEEK